MTIENRYNHMKTILIIYPHWYPANLAGVQRPRLIGNYLSSFGWKPRVLTVKEEFFEEKPDPDFYKLFSNDFEVTRVDALPINKSQKKKTTGFVLIKAIHSLLTLNHSLRLVGDIGLRAFFQLYKEAKHIIKTEPIDFIWLPIPSFYNALLGRLLYEKTKVPYGIDYIDPWVRDLSNQKNKRAIISQWIARLLEPIAIKKVSVISGVSTPYYAPVIQRNFPKIANQLLVSPLSSPLSPFTKQKITHIGMPYGFDPNDHSIKLEGIEYPWVSSQPSAVNSEQSTGDKENSPLNTPPSPITAHQSKIWLYAGAFLPNSHVLLDAFFKAIAELRKAQEWDEAIQLWFIGTGLYPAKRITAYAKDHGIDDIVFEKRERYPFLHILNFLSAADTVMVIGSTEQHYTASKTYQSILSERPVLSIFHYESSAVKVMEDCKADQYTVRYKPEMKQEDIVHEFKEVLSKRLQEKQWNPDLNALDQYSCKESARKLVEAMEMII
jgi:hypothetical protein